MNHVSSIINGLKKKKFPTFPSTAQQGASKVSSNSNKMIASDTAVPVETEKVKIILVCSRYFNPPDGFALLKHMLLWTMAGGLD